MKYHLANKEILVNRVFRFIRITVGVFLLFILVSATLTPQLLPISGQCVVNSKLRWDRTPIDGKVIFNRFNIGDRVIKGEHLGFVSNERAEDALLESLIHEESLANTAIETLRKRYEKLQSKKERLEIMLELAHSNLLRRTKRTISILETDLKLSVAKQSKLIEYIEKYELANQKISGSGKYAVVSRKMIDDMHSQLRTTNAHISNQKDKLILQKLNIEAAVRGISVSGITPVEQDRLKDMEDSMLMLQQEIEGKKDQVNVITKAIEKRKIRASLQTIHMFQASTTGIIWDVGYTDGSYVYNGDPLIAIADVDSLRIDCIFHQRYLDNISAGDFSTVNLMGSEQTMTGNVGSIMIRDQVKSADISAFNYLTPGTNEFKVSIEVGEKQTLPKIGQRAKVVITKNESSALLNHFFMFTK